MNAQQQVFADLNRGYKDPLADPARQARLAAAAEAGRKRAEAIDQYEVARLTVKSAPTDENVEAFRDAVQALAALGIDPACAGLPHDPLAVLPTAHRLAWFTRATQR